MQPLREEFDYIIPDTSPAMSYLTINGLMAANAMVMPLVPESLDFHLLNLQFWGLFADLCRTFADLEPNKAFDFVSSILSKVDNGRLPRRRLFGPGHNAHTVTGYCPLKSNVVWVGSEVSEFATILLTSSPGPGVRNTRPYSRLIRRVLQTR